MRRGYALVEIATLPKCRELGSLNLWPSLTAYKFGTEVLLAQFGAKRMVRCTQNGTNPAHSPAKGNWHES
jgi:hypothetical protein